ncbi:MAG: glycosyltransferase [Halioglobus sp.]
MKSVDVVIPVYDGLDETRACLESVLQTVDRKWARLVVIDDCSPNPDISAYLRTLAQQYPELVLERNTQNLGFVATANRGIMLDSSRDVLLLNSDVEVAGDWLTQIQANAYSADKIGSVTPFSNNATICSFPNFCKDNTLPFGLEYPDLAAYFPRLFDAGDCVDVPTGVGFCMYMRRECIDEVGVFNEERFGRGYGEENDWCQRALASGWRNVHMAGCFIYHKGGVSFGASQKPAVARAMEILDETFPSYHQDIQAYIAEDPARKHRMKVLLSIFAGVRRPKIALVSHSLGGGAQQHVNELSSLYRERALFLQISPESDGHSVRLSVLDDGSCLQDGLYFDIDTDYGMLVDVLRQLGIGRLHFHHTMGLHPRFWGLAADLDCPFDLTVHDYYLVNGNPTLTDARADFANEDLPDFDQRCAQHYPLPPGVDAGHWRESQRPLVEGAERVIFPSEDCRRRFGRYFDVGHGLVAHHPDPPAVDEYPEALWQFSGGRPLKVLVLGALSREKGADTLDRVAAITPVERAEFHLLGYAYRALGSAVITHGPYDNDAVDTLIADIDPDVIWLPARWPETYSYTLSIALRLGLPVVVPDIGACAERVAGRAHSVVQPWDNSVEQWGRFWAGVCEEQCLPAAAEVASITRTQNIEREFYENTYLEPIPASVGELDDDLVALLERHYSPGVQQLSRAERILAWLWRISRSKWVARLVSLVPFRLQRALKRRLSVRPMHDIVRDQ